jgi:signal transduction histidine kinase/CheY-like chemotaxis protein/HPt (histidine-containing phosphotransfer) domain-containing protein
MPGQRRPWLLPGGILVVGTLISIFSWQSTRHALEGTARTFSEQAAALSNGPGESIPHFVLVLGLIITLLTAFIAYVAIGAARRAGQLQGAQHEVAESRRVYEEVFENSEIAITDVDMSGLLRHLGELRARGITDLRGYLDEDRSHLETLSRLMRLNNINRAGVRLLGGESFSQFQTPDHFLTGDWPDRVREFALGTWSGATHIRKEAKHQTPTGKTIAFIYSLRLPKTLEESRRVPIVTLDVTDIQSAESARQASVAKSQFLASMSHEIRTPLNGVIGNLELLAQTDLRADQEEMLFDAEKAAKSLLALIGNILDFSKIEAGKLTIESVELNPADVVQEAVDIVQSRARQKGIYVTSFIGPDVPEIVKGDPTRIRQILLNLLGNSVKFTPHGGVHLNLNVRDWDDSICQLLFTVHDSGRGFDQALAQELFQPFTQDYKRTTEDFGGTGLGLSICKSLVDTFGGEIDCESVQGQGASFWFTIPVQVLKPAAAPAVPDLAERSVLFVNAVAGGLPANLLDYLESRHAHVMTAVDEEAALAIARKTVADGKSIDLAIYMAKRNQWPGSNFSSALREYRAMPMICASDASNALWRKALSCGASYLLPESVDPAFFDRNISQAFTDLPVSTNGYGDGDGVTAFDFALLAGKHALVLEDRLVNQTIIQRQLKKLRMVCTIADNGLAGLERLASGKFDLILCDCSMPEMNGYDFTRALRQIEQEKGDGSHIPVIAMTANAFREDMDKCFASGMDDFVSKPVTLHRLVSVLSHWIVQKQEQEHIKKTESAQPVADRSSSNGEAIDMSMLEHLLGTDDQEMIADIIMEFLSAAQESWREVQDNARKRDAGELSKAAHGAKGEAKNVGAVCLGELYEELEQTAKQKGLAGVEGLLAAIPAELQRVEVFAKEISKRVAS